MRENIEIWRVNVITRTNEKFIYINDGRVPMPGEPSGWGPVFPSYIRRFEMSLDGARAAIQGVNFGWNCNGVYCFPPPGGNVKSNGCSLGGSGGSCNIALSCSGGYCTGYFSGWHDLMVMGKLPGAIGPAATDLQLNTIESWLGHDVGQGAELIRWARNSDKWILQQIVFSGLEVGGGSNQPIGSISRPSSPRNTQMATGGAVPPAISGSTAGRPTRENTKERTVYGVQLML